MRKKFVAVRAAVCLVGLTICVAQAAAVITYVDATAGSGGNTTLVGGAQWDPLTADQGAANDGVWAQRAFGNSATIYQNAATGTVDNAHRLQTNLSGLAAGTYNVYAYFWSDSSNGWRIQASLTDNPGGDLPLFTPTTAGVVQFYTGADATVLSSTLAPNPFSSDVMIAEGNRRLYQAFLGQASGTSFPIFLDDSSSQADQNERTWYDGVGYERVPEPASVALLVLGIGLLTTGRRR
jgi:PEP-CTERM motif